MLENNSNLSELDKANFESHLPFKATILQGGMFTLSSPFLCPQINST